MKLIDTIRKIPHVITFQYWKCVESFSKSINPYWWDAVRYHRITGKKMNWHRPQGLTQKLLWLNRYWQPQLKADCADKYRMKDYVKSCGLDEINVPLIGIWNSPDEIIWDSLPQQFAMKTNHGCGTNIICKDKSQLNIKDAERKLRQWLKIDFGMLYNEVHYSKINRCILAEEYLPMKQFPLDYKIHCVNGEPCFFMFYPVHNETYCERISYSLDWKREYFIKGEEQFDYDVPRPKNLDKMVEYARILARPFPYVRIDFYEVGDRLYIGELTFTSFGNMFNYYYCDEIDANLGNKLVLPPKMV